MPRPGTAEEERRRLSSGQCRSNSFFFFFFRFTIRPCILRRRLLRRLRRKKEKRERDSRGKARPAATIYENEMRRIALVASNGLVFRRTKTHSSFCHIAMPVAKVPLLFCLFFFFLFLVIGFLRSLFISASASPPRVVLFPPCALCNTAVRFPTPYKAAWRLWSPPSLRQLAVPLPSPPLGFTCCE